MPVLQDRWHTIVVALAVAAGLTSASPAYAAPTTNDSEPSIKPNNASASPDEDVEQLNAAAKQRFKEGRYDDSIAFFSQAYALNPNPNYLFNIARVYETKGDVEQALAYYQQFIDDPDVDADARQQGITRRDALTATQATPASPPLPAESSSPTSRGPTKLGIAGYSLLGIGGATLLTGIGFAGAALAQARKLPDVRYLDERNDAIARGERNSTIADSLMISGGIITATGLVLTLVSLRKSRRRRDETVAIPVVTSEYAGFMTRMRF